MINLWVLYNFHFSPKVFSVPNDEHFNNQISLTLVLHEQPLSSVKDLGKSGKTLRQSFAKNSLCSKINFGAIQHGGRSSQIVPNF